MAGNNSQKQRLKIVVISTLIVLIIFNLSTWIIYFYMQESLDNEIGNRLIGIGKTVLLKIDTKIFSEREEIKKIEMQVLENYFVKVMNDNKLENIYIIDNNYNTILDPKNKLIKNISHSYIKKDELELSLAWNSKAISTKVYNIKGNYFKNAYLPITNKDSVQYLLCIEASIQVLKSFEILKITLFISNFLSIILALIFSFYLGRTIKDFIRIEEDLSNKEKFALMGELAACVAHEIRNPLGIIKGSGEILKKRYKEEDLVKYINEEIDRINLLINEFLNLSKDVVLNYQNININFLISNVKDSIEKEINIKKINVIIKLQENLTDLECDLEKLKQVFYNIFRNAFEAIETDGNIIITTFQEKKAIKIVIEDTGPGIAPENISKIFIPFFTTKKTGFGVGLYSSLKIIQAHGGTIEVESKIGKGSKFTIILPRKR